MTSSEIPDPALSARQPNTTANTTTSTTSKRKRDNDDEGRDDAQPAQSTQSPLRPLLPRTTTIAFHAAPHRQPAASLSSSPPSATTPRFSFIAPKPPSSDVTSPAQTGLSFASFVAGSGVAADLAAQETGASSPRTHVAHRFGSLAIAGGKEEYFGETGAAGQSEPKTDSEPALPLRKRMKRDDEPEVTTTGTEPTSSPPTSSPDRIITDPLRASLTWQDDEITVYDPNDADDDGTGVNGIGFKPTPAMALARALKRRQQLAAYRKREEREARARRSLQRTRGNQAARSAASAASSSASSSASQSSQSSGSEGVSLSQPMDPSTPRSFAAASLSSPTTTPSPLVRRVRFLETGPVTIRFKEPDAVPSPTSILST